MSIVNNDWCDICGRTPCACYELLGPAFVGVEEEETAVQMLCVETTAKGEPCKNKPMRYHTRCGPHQTKWEQEQKDQEAKSAPAEDSKEVPVVDEDNIIPNEEEEYDLPDPTDKEAPAPAPVKEEIIPVQAVAESDLFIVAGTGSRSLQQASPEGKAQVMQYMRDRCTRLKEKYGEKLVLMSGMAEGFDKVVALIALQLDIPLWCAIPSPDYGGYYWGRKSLTGKDMTTQFEDIISKAWRVTYVMPDPKGSNKYNKKYGSANFDRNDFMVAQANAFLVYDPNSAGTAQCLASIREAGKPFELVPVVK